MRGEGFGGQGDGYGGLNVFVVNCFSADDDDRGKKVCDSDQIERRQIPLKTSCAYVDNISTGQCVLLLLFDDINHSSAQPIDMHLVIGD